ncbi:hypothetical protein [Anaerosporobacter sp.]|uniref:hypothetical protein n=1 Tax=Anaerosporobacter sp. TaxID=1872529 RepID=UPI00286EB66E|nr:hypothetical protein [Anaerosporobacter sp.]
MKYREFIFVGEHIPQLTEKEDEAFLLHYQNSILVSLKKRKLLSDSQYERCVEELKKQYVTIQNQTRPRKGDFS